MKKQFADHYHRSPCIVNGKNIMEIDKRHVRVMAIAENYAMVRRPGAAPYCAPVKELVMK